MIPIKIDPKTFYTDTDSAFTSCELDPKLLGDSLDQYKDELKGKVFNEAYFIGHKKYGYWYIDGECRIECSVFSGVPRNSLTFTEVKNIFKGSIITKSISSRFFKSFSLLNINIRDTFISIKNTSSKRLINNDVFGFYYGK
jgi:hypothetical protein